MKIATLHGPLHIGSEYSRYVPTSKMDQALPPFFNRASPPNIGDWFIGKVVDRLLDYDELIVITANAPDADWDYINQECSALVLRGGYYIQPRWLSHFYSLDLFKKIKIPIVLFGAGLQAALDEKIDFEPEEKAILHYIHDSCAASSVRGESTAEALQRIGIKNAIVTGCPTVFWSRKPRLAIRPPNDTSAGFSFRQYLYSDDPALHAAQLRAIEIVKDKFSHVQVILQGEEVLLQHYLMARQWDAEFEARLERMSGTTLHRLQRKPLDLEHLRGEIHAMLDHLSRPAFVDWFMNNTFFSYDLGDYIRTYRSKGMIIGCRLHSNLLAIANETPTFYLTYDERIQEAVDLLAIPYSRLADFHEGIDLLGQDWGLFEKKYVHYYRELVRFLEANKLRHRLPPPEGAERNPSSVDAQLVTA